MKILILSFLCLSCLLLVHALPVENEISDDDVQYDGNGNANSFFDETLKAVKAQYGNKIDPLKLPEKKVNFDKKIGPFKLKGEAKLFDGELKGLKTLHRTADSFLKSDNGSIIAEMEVGLDSIDMRYHAELTLNKMHKNVLLKATTKLVDVKIKAKLNSQSQLEIQDFKIVKLQDLKVHVEGFTVLDPALDALLNVFLKTFDPLVKNLLEKQIKSMVGDLLKNFKM